MAAEFWLGATKDEYHADPALSQSALKVFISDPQMFYRQYVARTEPRKPATPSQEFGNRVEDLAFRGSMNAFTIPQGVLNEQGHRKGARWTAYENEMQAAHGENVQLLKPEEFSKPLGPGAVLQAVDALRGHQQANNLIWGESIKNVRIRWVDELTGLQCRCEIDLLHASAIIGDLKTAMDVTVNGFHRAVLNFGYYIQAFMYREALRHVAMHLDQQEDSEVLRFARPMLERIRDGENILCAWIAVKNKQSHYVEAHPTHDEWYVIAEPIVRAAMFDLKAAYDSGHWQTKTHGQFTNLKPLPYAYKALEELSTEE